MLEQFTIERKILQSHMTTYLVMMKRKVDMIYTQNKARGLPENFLPKSQPDPPKPKPAQPAQPPLPQKEVVKKDKDSTDSEGKKLQEELGG